MLKLLDETPSRYYGSCIHIVWPWIGVAMPYGFQPGHRLKESTETLLTSVSGYQESSNA